jgi:ATP-dependent DNA helicase RecG
MHVEFKESLKSKSANEKVAKVICSFANTAGGILFLGVNDDGIPVNSIEKPSKDTISRIVSTRIEPSIMLEFRFIDIEDFSILAVLVAEGEEKPYLVKNHGVFVRYNGTTKQTTRTELMSMVGPSDFS